MTANEDKDRDTMENLIVFLIPFLVQVESGGNPDAVGDGGRSVGVLQISTAVVDDVNRILGKHVYSYADRNNAVKSTRMCQVYLAYWGMQYQKKRDAAPDWRVLARIWNGGPDGWRKRATDDYVLKVKRAMEKGKQ